jgi:hypothetical protein
MPKVRFQASRNLKNPNRKEVKQMNRKMVLPLMVVAFLVLPTAMTASAAEPGDPDTTITLTDATLECGSTAVSQILITIANQEIDPEEVRGVEVHLDFNPTLLQVVDADGDSGNGVQLAVESELFDGDLRIGQNLADNAAGTIVFAVAQSNGTPVFNATDAAIATITWECAGECPVEQVATEVTVVGNTLMSDPDGYPVAADCAVSGIITIPACVTTGCIEGTDATGYFKLEGLEPGTYGTYDVMAEMPGYLDALASGVQVVAGEECTDIGATKLLGGDVVPPPTPEDPDIIDINDITYIASRFGSTDPNADVNGDGVVNILDLTVASANFNMVGPTSWAA